MSEKKPVAQRVAQTWRYVQLFIGFHRDPKGAQRKEPYVWSPKNARATIKDDPKDQEVFCVVGAGSGKADDDIQIKLHPDKIVLRRGSQDYWQGIIVSEFDVQVQINGIWIKVGHDGMVKRQTDFDTTYVEADGTVLKETPYSKAMMSADGLELSSNSPEVIAAITPDGILHKQKG